jgi:hypothetical protein
MKKQETRSEPEQTKASSGKGKKRWQEPKLTFVRPKLTEHGKLEEVTGQFFGGFTPPAANS